MKTILEILLVLASFAVQFCAACFIGWTLYWCAFGSGNGSGMDSRWPPLSQMLWSAAIVVVWVWSARAYLRWSLVMDNQDVILVDGGTKYSDGTWIRFRVPVTVTQDRALIHYRGDKQGIEFRVE